MVSNEYELNGQVAVVTGGGRGIGQSIAVSLAKAGAAVAVVARTEGQIKETVGLIEKNGGTAVAVSADVTDQHSVDHMITQVSQNLGSVSILINNAGIAGPIGPVADVDPEEWFYCLDVNLRGSFLCAKSVVSGMIKKKLHGRIIFVTSGSALGPMKYASAYAVSKCAATRLAENLAVETREQGISVFSIHPGFVRTAFTEAVADSPEGERWLPGIGQNLSEGNDVSSEHAANLAVLLASGKADALSGCYISFTDDVLEMVSHATEIQEKNLHRLRLALSQ